MKTSFILVTALFVLSISAKSQTQKMQKRETTKANELIVIPQSTKSQTKTWQQQPETMPNTSAQAAPSSVVYSLASARVKIHTGNDNKESPSRVGISVFRSGVYYSEFDGTQLPGKLLFYNSIYKSEPEIKVNSDTDFSLESDYPIRPDEYWFHYSSTPINYYPAEVSLDKIQQDGLKLIIYYMPHFFLDAWKVENVTLTLEFKDAKGNPHPTLGTKDIVFSSSSVLTE